MRPTSILIILSVIFPGNLVVSLRRRFEPGSVLANLAEQCASLYPELRNLYDDFETTTAVVPDDENTQETLSTTNESLENIFDETTTTVTTTTDFTETTTLGHPIDDDAIDPLLAYGPTTTEAPPLTSTTQKKVDDTTIVPTTSNKPDSEEMLEFAEDSYYEEFKTTTSTSGLSSESETPEEIITTTTVEPSPSPALDSSTTRKGKVLDIPDGNLIKEISPISLSDDLTQLIQDLRRKIEDLEATQQTLHENIDELKRKLEDPDTSPSSALPEEEKDVMEEMKDEATTDLVSGNANLAVEKWKDITENVTTPEELGNVTSAIVEDALDKGAAPSNVFDFTNKLSNPIIQEKVYDTIADKMNNSDSLQEKIYWRDLTEYCRQVEQNIGQDNPSTRKMYFVQDQIRLNAVRPIAQTSFNIQHQDYLPAVSHWLTMVRDIPESPFYLERNMKRVMLRTYEGNPINLPFAFHFILILPQNQGYYKQVAYKCLTQEMRKNGHYYTPNN